MNADSGKRISWMGFQRITKLAILGGTSNQLLVTSADCQSPGAARKIKVPPTQDRLIINSDQKLTIAL